MTFIVWTGLTGAKRDIKGINKFFKDRGWGKVKFILQFKTKSGQGGSGGRTDVVFKWTAKGNEMAKFSVGRFRLGGISWLGDYVNNNRNIVPTATLKKLRLLVKKSGDFKEQFEKDEE